MGTGTRSRRLVLVVTALGLALATAATASAPRITVRVGRVGTTAVAFRVAGYRECDSVVSDANVIAWVGPQVDIYVRRGASLVAHSNWEACTLPSGKYLSWELSGSHSGQDWLQSGSRNVVTLKPRVTRAGTYRYTYRVTLNAHRYRKGTIVVTTTGPGTYRITLR